MAKEPISQLDTRFSDPDASPTPWADVEELLRTAELFWISTVRHDGRPHVTPLPAVWRDDALYFCTGPAEQKAVNLVRDPRCVLTTGNNAWKSGLDVMLEGTALRVTDEDHLRVLAHEWETKYNGDWKYDVVDRAFHHDAGVAYVYEVAPDKILAFSKGNFAQTRYFFLAG